MDKKVFQSGTAITPEFINELQNLSFSKAANEVGHLPNPDDQFHFQQWRTFTIDENNRINLGDYQRNVIIVPSAKDQSVTLDHFPSNGIIIYAPDWDSESESTFVTIGDPNWATSIIKGGVEILYSFGTPIPIVARSLISHGALAYLKQISVDKLIVESDLTLPALSILSEYIATGAVTTDKIATGAVTTGKISTHAVETDKIADGAITREKIFYGEVTTDKLANYAVETDKIANGAVDSFKLAEQLTFVKRPFLPPNILYSQEVESEVHYGIIKSLGGVQYKGIIFYDDVPDAPASGWRIKLHITDADPNFANGVIYRIYNNTFSDVNVMDYTTDSFYTRLPAWSFKDFYHLNGWRMD